MLDLAINEWSTMRSFSKGKRYPSVVYNEKLDRLYLLGGQSSGNSFSKTVEKYTFGVGEINGWEDTSSQAPKKFVWPTTVSDGWFIYAYDYAKYTSSNEKLFYMDVRTESWTILATHEKGRPKTIS